MRQGQQNRRSRGRGRKQQNPLSRNYESNGPDVKIRGTASHIAEKYSSLARDAIAAGDMVTAENYYQHAEHYQRIILSAQTQAQSANGQARDGEAANTSASGAASEGEDVAVAANGQSVEEGAAAEEGAGAQQAQENSGNRRGGGRRRSNGNGRGRSGNGDGRRSSSRSSSEASDDVAAAGEFAGLPPSVTSVKPRGNGDGVSESASDGDAAESTGDDSAVAS